MSALFGDSSRHGRLEADGWLLLRLNDRLLAGGWLSVRFYSRSIRFP
jgi:hypothetical protein